jgi:hypothetical protein
MLDTIYAFCQREAARCADVVATQVANISASMRQAAAADHPEALRLVVRPAAYVESIRQAAAGRAEFEPIARPFVGGLWMLCVLDQPGSVAYLNEGTLKRLGLSADEAIALARRNTAEHLRPRHDMTRKPGDKAISRIVGDTYESSRLLLHEDWAPMAKQMKGGLVVTIPVRETVLYAEEDEKAVAILAKSARDLAREDSRPISTAVFRWTPTGWEEVQR